MKINFENTIEDYLAFLKDYLVNSKQFKKIKFLALLIVPTTLLFLWILEFSVNNITKNWLYVYLFFSIIWIISIQKNYLKTVLKRNKKIFLKMENNPFLWNCSMTFENDSIIIEKPNFETKLKYSWIVKIVEVYDYLFLYISDISAYIIPKNKVDWIEEVISLLKSKNLL